MSGNSRRNGPRLSEACPAVPGSKLTTARRRKGRLAPALLIYAIAGVLLADGPTGAARAQESLLPAQKAALLFTAYRKFGGKVTYRAVADHNRALTIRGLSYKIPLPARKSLKRGRREFLSMTAETMVVRRFDYRHPDLPYFADLAIKGVRLGEGVLNRDDRRMYQAVFGQSEIIFDVRQKYKLDPATGSLSYREFSIAVRGVAVFSLNARLDGIDFAKLSNPDFWEELVLTERGRGRKGSTANAGEMLLEAASQVKIHALSYSLTDLGGVGKAMAYAAMERSKKNPTGSAISVDMMRDMVAGALAGANARFSGAFAADVLEKAGRFAIAPGTLTFTAKPERPLPMARLIGFVVGFAATIDWIKGRKIDLDPLQKFFGLSVSYAPAAR